MKSQKVKVIVNDIENNGIISLEEDIISIDMGIANQIISFRDISVYDKRNNSTLSLILNNNKKIDLNFKDYLLLYKLIDDFKKNQVTQKPKNSVICPECGENNDFFNLECTNCGYILKKDNINYKKRIFKVVTFVFVSLIIISVLSFIIINKNNYDDNNVENDQLEQNTNSVSDNEKKIIELMEKYSDGFDMDASNLDTILNDRVDFDWIKNYKNNLELLIFYNPWHDYDYDNNKLLEPKIIYCLIIKSKVKDNNIEASLYDFKNEHYYEKKLGVSIKTDSGIIKPEFSDSYVNASKNGIVGLVGNYYYYIATTDQNFTEEMINLLRSLD